MIDIDPYNSPWNKRGKVHLFEKFGKRFVFDVASGVIIELDDISWALTSALAKGTCPESAKKTLLKKNEPEAVERAFDELLEFYLGGDLFSADSMVTLNAPAQSSFSNLCLIISEDCNLNCDYCFTEGGSFGRKPQLMALDTAKSAIDLLFEQSGNKRVSISYFGGEPLLNFPVVSATTDYARKKAKEENKSVHFNITTNATLINAQVRRFLSDHPDISVIFSVDGDAEIHNRHRKFNSGHGSFETVAKNLATLFKTEKADSPRFSARGTYTNDNMDLRKASQELLKLGFKNISIEPAIIKGTDLELTEKNLSLIKQEYDDLAAFYLQKAQNNNPFSFFHFQVAMEHISNANPMLKPCGAGVGYIAVAADGSLYPCHRFIGDDRFKMGDVWQGVTDKEIVHVFSELDVNRKATCQDCWAKYHCGGGCHRHAMVFNEDLHEPYDIECELLKYRLELCAYLYVELIDRMEEIRAQFQDPVKTRPELDPLTGPHV